MEISSSELDDWARFYSSFEKQFRGSQDEISRRQSVYLPVLEQANIRDLGAPILDIGCGRCEWIELLEHNDLIAKGLDLNKEFVEIGASKGLDVIYGDALDYLRDQADDTFSAVTSFHLVEHLPFLQLRKLIAEIHRVLRPGGIVILETPNPENVSVGACSFYFDPTHRAPLPPGLLNFVVSEAGFAEAHTAYVNADCIESPLAYVPHDFQHAPQINSAIQALNKTLFSAPDYAVVAQKKGGKISLGASEALKKLKDSIYVDSRQSGVEENIQHAYVQRLEREIAAIYASKSWRLTYPLRVLQAWLRKMRNPN